MSAEKSKRSEHDRCDNRMSARVPASQAKYLLAVPLLCIIIYLLLFPKEHEALSQGAQGAFQLVEHDQKEGDNPIHRGSGRSASKEGSSVVNLYGTCTVLC